MGTTLPADPTKSDLDQGTDDPKQARSELVTLVDAVVAILDALGVSALYNLASAGGLTVDSQPVGTPDELKIKVQSQAGLILESGGVRLSINDLPAAGALATGDEMSIRDFDGTGHKHRKIALSAFLDAIAGSGLARNGVQLEATGWNLLTSLDTSSGQSVETTAISATALRIELVFDRVSIDGNADEVQIEIGSTSYATVSEGVVGEIESGSGAETPWGGSGPAVITRSATAAMNFSGKVELSKQDDNHWSVSGMVNGGATQINFPAGRIELASAMDRLKSTISGTPTDSFDGGKIHVWVLS